MAEREGCLLVKLQHGVAGMPDRLLLRPNGTCAFIEFKRPGSGRVTKIQAYWHKRLRAQGFQVEVVRHLPHLDRVLTGAT